MRAFALVAALVLALVACAPATAPTTDPAAGVVLTAMPIDGATTYRVEVNPSVDRLFLRFVGTDLATGAAECAVVAGAVECILGAVANWFELTVSGVVRNDPALPFGVACRTSGCSALYLEVPRVE